MSVTIARIWVDGIEVGALPRDVYEAIVKDVRRDWRLYVAQTIGWATAIMRFAFRTLLRTTVLFALLAMAAILFAPDMTTTSVQELTQLSPLEEVRALRTCVYLFWVAVFFNAVMALILAPHSVGPVSAFSRAINWRVRELLEVPARGDIAIRFEDVQSYE